MTAGSWVHLVARLGRDRDAYLREVVEVGPPPEPPRCPATYLFPAPDLPVLSCALYEHHPEEAHVHLVPLVEGRRVEWTEVDGEVTFTVHDDRARLGWVGLRAR